MDSHTSKNSDPPSKRRRLDNQDKPQVNRIYGQTGAFPGLDGSSSDVGSDVGNELQDDPIAYLRSVRKQANRIPTLLTSSRPHEKDPGLLYGGDAIVAAPFIGPPRPPIHHAAATRNREASQGANHDIESVDGEEQEQEQDDEAYDDELHEGEGELIAADVAYHTRLLAEYASMQSLIKDAKTRSNASSLPRRSEKQWLETIAKDTPTPSLLASLELEHANAGLTALAHSLKWRDLTDAVDGVRKRSAWCWGLLACLDVGNMNYDDIGRVRELGKKAATMLERPPKQSQQQMSNGSQSDGSAPPEDVEARRSQMITDQNNAPDIPKALQIAASKINSTCSERATAQIMKWMDSLPGLRELCERVAEAEGDLTLLDEEDQAAFTMTVETAIEESAKSDVPRDAEEQQGELMERNGKRAQPKQSDSNRGKDGHVNDEDDAEEGELAEEEPLSYEDRLKGAYATLDMILTVVGEVFGQRDLLESRDACWEMP